MNQPKDLKDQAAPFETTAGTGVDVLSDLDKLSIRSIETPKPNAYLPKSLHDMAHDIEAQHNKLRVEGAKAVLAYLTNLYSIGITSRWTIIRAVESFINKMENLK